MTGEGRYESGEILYRLVSSAPLFYMRAVSVFIPRVVQALMMQIFVRSEDIGRPLNPGQKEKNEARIAALLKDPNLSFAVACNRWKLKNYNFRSWKIIN